MECKNSVHDAQKISMDNQLLSYVLCVYLACSPIALFVPTPTYANPIADPNAAIHFQPTVYSAANNIPVVDIVMPNSNGISHNLYEEFSVGEQGAVLNNSLNGGESQLAGGLIRNHNFNDKSASLIINEVTSNTNSSLNGLLEVFGDKAELIIANANGISCNGCGFINTEKLTLTTGQINTIADDVLLQIEKGEIVIGEDGLYGDDTGLKKLQLLARYVNLQGEAVATSDLTAITGVFNYQYTNDTLEIVQPLESPHKTLAIDGSRFGALRAGSISIMATELGMGVNVPGYLGADAGDLFLQVDGAADLASLKAENIHLDIKDAINHSGSIQAKDDVHIAAESFTAAKNSQLQAGSTLNLETELQQSLQDVNAKMLVLKSSDVDFHGQTTVHDTLSMTADNSIRVNQGSEIDTRNFHSDSQRLTIDGQLRIDDGVSVDTEIINLSENALFAAENSHLSLDVMNFDNLGSVSSQGLLLNSDAVRLGETASLLAENMAINSADVENNGLIQSNAALSLHSEHINQSASGTMAGDSISIQSDGFIHNAGAMVAEDSVYIASDGLMNQGRVFSSGRIEINSDTFNNSVQALLFAKLSVDILAKLSVSNHGQILSGDVLVIQAAADTSNEETGLVQARSVQLQSVAGNVNNAGIVRANDAINIVAVNFQQSVSGQLYVQKNTAENLGNSYIAINATEDALNHGTIVGNADVAINAVNIINSQSIVAGNNLSLGAQSQSTENILHYTPDGSAEQALLFAGNNLSVVASEKVSNDYGIMQSLHDLSVLSPAFENLSRYRDSTNYVELLYWDVDYESEKSGGRTRRWKDINTRVLVGDVLVHAPAQLLAANNLYLQGNLINESSIVSAGNTLHVASDLDNQAVFDENAKVTAYKYRSSKERDKDDLPNDFESATFNKTRFVNEAFNSSNGSLKILAGNKKGNIYTPKSTSVVSSGIKIAGSKGSISAKELILDATLNNQGVINVEELLIAGVHTSISNNADDNIVSADTVEDLADNALQGALNGFDDNVISPDTGVPNSAIDLMDYYDDYEKTPSIFALLQGSNTALVEGSDAESFAEMLFNAGNSVGQNDLQELVDIREVLATDVQFFFDPVQEAALLRSALLHNNGIAKVYDEQWQTEKEQLQMLYDNAMAFSLQNQWPVGEALNELLLVDLELPMIWYENREIAGEKKLTPILYLAQAKPASMLPGGSLLADNIHVDIDGDFINTGYVAANNSLSIEARDILQRQRSLQVNHGKAFTLQRNEAGGNSLAKNIDWQAKRNIQVSGGSVQAAEDVRLHAKGNVTIDAVNDLYAYERKDDNSHEVYRESKVRGSNIKAGNNVLIQGDNISVTASMLRADDALLVTAEKDIDVLAGVNQVDSYTKTKSKAGLGKSETRIEESSEKNHQGSRLEANNIVLNANAGDLTVQASEVIADRNIAISAADNINLKAAVDEQRLSTIQSSRNMATEEIKSEGYIKQQAAATQLIAGKDITIDAAADVAVASSYLKAGDSLSLGDAALKKDTQGRPIMDSAGNFIKADGTVVQNITIGTIELRDEDWYEVSKTLKGPLKGLANALSTVLAAEGIKAEIKTGYGEEQRTTAITQSTSGLQANDIALHAQQDVTLNGAAVSADESVEIFANNVTIDAVENKHIDDSRVHDSVSKGLGYSLEEDEFRLGGLEKITHTESTIVTDTKWQASQISANNINIKANDNVLVLSSSLSANTDISVDAGEMLSVGGREDSQHIAHNSETEVISTSVGVKNAYLDVALALIALNDARKQLNAADDALDNAKDKVKQGKLREDDLKYYQMNKKAAEAAMGNFTVAVAAAIASAVLIASTSYGTGLYVSGKAETTTTQESLQTLQTQWVGSDIKAGNNAKLVSGERLNIDGSKVDVANDLTLASEDINITAGESHSSESFKRHTESKGASFSYNLASASGGVNSSYSDTAASSKSTRYSNSAISAGNLHSNSDSLTIAGANIIADDVAIVTDTFTVKSLQDSASNNSETQAWNHSVGFGDGGVSSAGIGASVEESEGEKQWVNNQTSIVGTNSINIKAKDSLLVGAFIANAQQNQSGHWQDKGGLEFSSETLRVEDIHDTDVYNTKGASIGVTIATNNFRDIEQSGGASTLGLNEIGYEKAQTSNATLGMGNIIVGQQALNNTQLNALAVKQNLNGSQQLTLDITTGGLAADFKLDHNWLSNQGREKISNDFSVSGKSMQKVGNNVEMHTGAQVGGILAQVPILLGQGDIENKQMQVVSLDSKYMNGREDEFEPVEMSEAYLSLPSKKRAEFANKNLYITKQGVDVNEFTATYQNFTNGMLNDMGLALLNGMQQTSDKDNVAFTLNYNPTHGGIGDLLESATDKVGIWHTGMAKQTGEFIRDVTTARGAEGSNFNNHSQGNILTYAGMKYITNKGSYDNGGFKPKEYFLKDDENMTADETSLPTFAGFGSAMNTSDMEVVVKNAGFNWIGNFTHEGDFVGEWIGKNKGENGHNSKFSLADALLLLDEENSPHSSYGCGEYSSARCGDR